MEALPVFSQAKRRTAGVWIAKKNNAPQKKEARRISSSGPL